jgi:FtsH-binding integral membrane protein
MRAAILCADRDVLPKMTRAPPSRSLAYAVSLTLMAVGSLTAHSVAYRAVAPDGDERMALLEHSGHGYLAYAHLGLALCVTVVLVGVLLVVVGAMKGRSYPAVPAWLFGVVVSLGFTVQEHVERFVASGELPLDVVLEPTFAVALLLQFAFALAAAFLARALLALGEVVGRALAGRRPGRLAGNPSRSKCTSSAARPRSSILAVGHAQRAPPLHLSFG